MAIAIPSKNIFEKKNPKVKDNLIERIEVTATNVVPNNGYGTTVYNETVSSYDIETRKTDNGETKCFSSGESWSPSKKLLTVAYASAAYIDQKVWSNTIYIPLLQYDKYIKSVLSGENKETGESNIGCSIYGRVEKYDVSSKTPWFILDENNVTQGELEYKRTNGNDNTETIFDFPSDVEATPQGFNLTAKAKIGDYDNLKTATFHKETIDGVDYYVGSLEVLAEVATLQFSGSSTQEFSTSEDYTAIPVNMVGSFEKYIPTRIEFTFMGDSIGIELNDSTEYINGKTAKKVFSVDGNELMQTSNYYEEPVENDVTLEIKRKKGPAGSGIALLATPSKELTSNTKLYYKGETALVVGGDIEGRDVEIMVVEGGAFYREVGNTISCSTTVPIKADSSIQRSFGMVQQHYQNGKETATLRCSIGEYYNSAMVTIGGELSGDGYSALFELFVNDGTVLEIGSKWAFNGVLFEVVEYDSYDNYYTILSIGRKIFPYQGVTGYALGALAVSAKDTTLPMTFSLYDNVVPFVYDFVDGECKDVPMSKYPDGRAKVFKVLSVRTFYDGATWQDIEVQEV